MFELHGEELAAPRLRKFVVRDSELHPCFTEVKMAFLAVKNANDWRAMIDRWYGDEHLYPPVTRRARPEALIAAGASWDCQAEPV